VGHIDHVLQNDGIGNDLLLQSSRMPDAAGLGVIRRVCESLAQPLDSAGFAELGQVAGE
jgi:hypothetical protein